MSPPVSRVMLSFFSIFFTLTLSFSFSSVKVDISPSNSSLFCVSSAIYSYWSSISDACCWHFESRTVILFCLRSISLDWSVHCYSRSAIRLF